MIFLAACRDECSNKVDFGHCEGNVAVNCPTPGPDQIVPVRWSHKDCAARVCVLAGTAALCVLDGGMSPFCANGDPPACDGQTRVRCSSGFETSRDPCLSCDPDGGICAGGPSTKCSGDSDCAAPLSCRDAGTSSFCFSAP